MYYSGIFWGNLIFILSSSCKDYLNFFKYLKVLYLRVINIFLIILK